jgi:hypothetical protein
LTRWKSATTPDFKRFFETIRQMLATPIPAKKPIGFHAALELQAKPGKSGDNKRK